MADHGPGRHRRSVRQPDVGSSRLRRARRYVGIRLGLIGLAALAVVALRNDLLPFGLPVGDHDLVARAAANLDRGDGPREVHLTFDDGPTADATPQILDLLAEYGAQATFFPVGEQVASGADVLRRAVADGHAIGNHTWRHDRLVGLPGNDVDASVRRTQEAVQDATGTTPTCLRPPGGVIDETAASHAVAVGMSIELWTIDPQDWRSPGSDEIAASVLNGIRGTGDVVLLHDGGGDRRQTVEALDDILDALRDHDYRMTAIPGC